MAVIHTVGDTRVDEFGVGDIFDPMLVWFRELTAVTMWKWYDEHRNDPLVTIGVWVLRYSVKVKHVKPLFLKLFGPRP